MIVILGNGKLAKAFKRYYEKNNIVHTQFKRPKWEYPFNGFNEIKDLEPSFIINCISYGSVEEGNRNFSYQNMIHVSLPVDLAKNFPKTKILNFSSNYAIDPKSLYAITKQSMENALLLLMKEGKCKSRFIRVESLWSKDDKNSFVNKIAENFKNEKPVKTVNNYVAITDVDNLVSTIISNIDSIFSKKNINNPMSFGSLDYKTVYEHAMAVAREMNIVEFDLSCIGWDESRPKFGSAIDDSFIPVPRNEKIYTLVASSI